MKKPSNILQDSEKLMLLISFVDKGSNLKMIERSEETVPLLDIKTYDNSNQI